MPKHSLHQNDKGEWVMSADALVTRLRRHLPTLLPHRQLQYNAQTCGYYTRVVSHDGDNGMSHGPYYYKHMVGLARMTNAMHGADKAIVSIALYDRKWNYFPEEPLPFKLKWPVITPALADMLTRLHQSQPGKDAFIERLKREGYTVSQPAVLIPKSVSPPAGSVLGPSHVPGMWEVTSAVTDDMPEYEGEIDPVTGEPVEPPEN